MSDISAYLDKTCAVILNWNAYLETIECIENVVGAYSGLSIIVIDNFSSDNSLHEIKEHLSLLAVNSGALFFCVDENDFGRAVNEINAVNSCCFILVKAHENYGFAGGNNRGLSVGMKIKKFDYFWMLNNDARINHNSLPELLKVFCGSNSVGFVGSVLCDYYHHDVIQCFGGGNIYKWIGKRKLYLKGEKVSYLSTVAAATPDYLMGASLLVKKRVLETVGLMDEFYFMYAEELDWQLRAKKNGWHISVAPGSIVYHKGAVSTKGRSYLYHYYLNRSSIIFTRRFYSYSVLISVLIFLPLVNTFKLIKEPKNLAYAMKGIVDGLFFKYPSLF